MRGSLSRRGILRLGLSGAAGLLGVDALSRLRRTRAEANPLTTYVSPTLPLYVDELPRIPMLAAPGRLVAAAARHRFHRDLPLDHTWSFGGMSYLGPTLESRHGEATDIRYENELGRHLLEGDLDLTLMGMSEHDFSAPRSVVHLHGGLTEPGSDGHPLATTRPGHARRHHYSKLQEATGLWYHDHSLGLTRANVFLGLAGQWLARDDFDTGRADNSLGLPSGDFEVPLVLQDRTFTAEGLLNFRTSTYVAQGAWEGGQAGDLAVVNGKVTPNMTVARSLYRFRLLNASNLRMYRLEFSNQLAFFAIGSDQGLFDAPVPTSTLRIAPGERYDLLVDFSSLSAGEHVELVNVQRLPFQFQIFGDPEIRHVMQFTASDGRGDRRSVPLRLRGYPGAPPSLPPLPVPTRVRDMTVAQLLDLGRFPPALMNLNNMMFDTGDVDVARLGTVEQWNIINLTTDDHPVHVHLARIRVLGRQPFDKGAYEQQNPRPELGVRWAPSADGFTTEPAERPEPWEVGLKDTVYAPPDTITRILVVWPSAAELDFDPDAGAEVPCSVAEGAPTMDAAGKRALRFHPAVQDQPTRVRGYVWHCHIVDHEDHDMMLPIRVQGG